jgi:hypothetical protein
MHCQVRACKHSKGYAWHNPNRALHQQGDLGQHSWAHLFRELNHGRLSDAAVPTRHKDDLACEVLGQELLATPWKGRHDGEGRERWGHL